MIVVSDIHGHLDRFISLLKKVNYCSEDYLIIIGDFVEKGDQVLETIHYIQKLDENERTFVLTGNCEVAMQVLLTIPEFAKEINGYFKRVSSNGLLRQTYEKLNLKESNETVLGIQKAMADHLENEIKYISSLLTTLKINDFLFVHAGIERGLDYKENSLSSLLEMKYFYNQGHDLNHYVIVGHMPTSNYDDQAIYNDIIINEEKKIICIDGGTGVKPISQLNALIIENRKGNITFQKESVQPLPIMTIKEDVVYDNKYIHKISFPYFEVKILNEEEQFSLCYQAETNQKLYIKNEFLYTRNNKTYCLDDYVDYIHNLHKGDKVKIIGVYDLYAYAIYEGKIGWINIKHIEEL